MKLIETKGIVKFYKDDNGKLHQQIGEGKVEKVRDGSIKYKYIKKVGDFFIQYDLNGVNGFSICKDTNTILEDNIWDLDKAVEVAQSLQSFA